MKRAIHVFWSAAILTVAGCTTDVANRYYTSKTYPPKQPSAVQVLSAKPSRPFEVIADFQSRGDTPESIRKKAAKIGADAVIVVPLGGIYDRSEQWAGHDSKEGSYTRIAGTAIVYTDK
jgi:hypothetical protein